MRVLVTGADGFVGKWLCAELISHGHSVVGAVPAPGNVARLSAHWRTRLAPVEWAALDFEQEGSVSDLLARAPDAIVHLAAIASGAVARTDPVRAWRVNCLGTCALVYGLERCGLRVRVLFASTGEVYGRALQRPALETDQVAPCSPYAASKAAAEQVLMEAHRRLGLDVVITRPFAQTGPGQRTEFVVPAFADRILEAKEQGKREVPVGNLDPVREFLDVRDVGRALGILLERGEAGQVYNIAAGKGISLRDLFARLAQIVETDVAPVVDPQLHRPADIPYLVGDGGRIARLGWRAEIPLEVTLRELAAELAAPKEDRDRASVPGNVVGNRRS